MQHSAIVSHLYHLTDPSEVIFSVSMQQVIQQITRRMGDDAMSLTAEDLELAKEEVIAAIEHSLDYRPYVEEGIESFLITRQL